MQLEPLIARFRGPLTGFFAGRGAPANDASELAQDVFAEAYLTRARFRGDWSDARAAGAWLAGIAKNLLRAWRRSRRLTLMPPVDLGAVAVTAPREDTDRALRDERVRGAIARLRQPWRTVLFMHYLEGSGLAEIAALLQISERAVEGRLRRARHELRRVLQLDATGRKQIGEARR